MAVVLRSALAFAAIGVTVDGLAPDVSALMQSFTWKRGDDSLAENVQKANATEGHNASEGHNATEGMIPIPLPIPVGLFPVKVVLSDKTNPRPIESRWSSHRARQRFWSPAYDPDWQRGATHSTYTNEQLQGAPTRKQQFVGKCEHILIPERCTNSMQIYGFQCRGWGGQHCIPVEGWKCSDFYARHLCGNLGLSCTWTNKGCSKV
mmetsp:Transcript_21936/g.63246  ORF Transcript_21936/g.63246 Transcript_21936/m.63246 type:complete len:206 (+) Transcript_21936:96-713(+)